MLLPIFPLPTVVLFPNVFLPLHVFEPRYREMMADALVTDRLIGMVLLRPGWESDYEGRPPVYPIGCSGVITHVDLLPDGCYDVVLRGLEKFRITEEDHRLGYRRAHVDTVVEPTAPDDLGVLRQLRERLEALLARPVERRFEQAEVRVEHVAPAAMSDADLVNALAQYLDLEPVEKQALLERQTLRARAESLVELLEMKALVSKNPWRAQLTH